MSAVNAPLPQSNDAYAEPRSAEPSMEDILASIRRIIADDQSRNAASMSASFRKQTGPVPPVEQEARPLPTNEPVVGEAVSPVLQGSYAQPHLNVPLSPALDEATTSSLVDRIADEAVSSILRPRFSSQAESTPEDLAANWDASTETVDAQPLDLDSSAVPEAATEPLAPSAPAEPFVGASTASHFALEVDAVDLVEPDREQENLIASLQGTRAPSVEPETLVSPEAGATVGSAFQTLATSVVLQNSDTIEKLTREMLRPLLKSWLDDHLPALVERLVRQEIERLARGGRPSNN
ncbi:PopZ family protein [Lichenihabitans psoromatis]|uniref:PopZ family protein n=1 Tax=Lichenihabitans psoromatis TaxID=2528642 RepID=UPI001038496B|nr:DUF2497 domain-containing protein [Lichenihabitans psoromatis]